MKAQRAILFNAALLSTLFMVAPPVAAHNWGCYRQGDRSVRTYNAASRRTQATAAINDWHNRTILNLPTASSSSFDIRVLDGNYGNTGWGGLASIDSASGCIIVRGTARLNLYYQYSSNAQRGVFCQEVGHLFGLQHSNDGGCMGGGYYYDIGVSPHYLVSSHNVSDISTKYASVPALTSAAAETSLVEEADADLPTFMATWDRRPDTLREALGLADAVVLARVTDIREGDPLAVTVGDGDVDVIPTTNVSLRVTRRITGRTARNIELFQTGNAEARMDEDGPYTVGDAYLLFLARREDGTYRLISPEGRLQVTEAGLKAAAHEGFTTLMNGARLEGVLSDLAAAQVDR